MSAKSDKRLKNVLSRDLDLFKKEFPKTWSDLGGLFDKNIFVRRTISVISLEYYEKVEEEENGRV